MPETRKLPMFNTSEIQPTPERFEANRNTRPPGYEADWWECLICGRPTSTSSAGVSWVHMSERGNLYPAGATDEQIAASGEGDQGSFPVGGSCARKIPAAYKTRA